MKHLPINLENYEEYFLLYVDDELTEAEKKDVELFTRQYPELKEELTSLMDTRLDPEEIRMDLKQDLYRSEENAGIDASNFESLQLSLIDDELDEKEAGAILAYSQNHPDAKANLEWLRKAKLEPEAIQFPDKSLLYRTAEKPALVIRMRWYRMAAAAAILLAAGLWFLNRPDEDGILPAASVTVAQQLGTGDKTGDEANALPGKSETAEPEGKNEQAVPGDITSTSSKPGVERNTTRNTSNAEQVPVHVTETKSVPNGDQIQGIAENTIRKPIEDVVQTGSDPMLSANELNAQPQIAIQVKSDYATDALNSDNRDVLSDQTTIEDQNKPRKGMFRGLVRKANRFYNKVTNPDMDRPLVKVANIEIGLPR